MLKVGRKPIHVSHYVFWFHLLGNGMRGLWFQPPLAAEKREAMGFLTWQPEHTLLLEARLCGGLATRRETEYQQCIGEAS